ncbi:hypothetical protein PR048_011751 [Dryococelus australis]|uniref:C2H2-type domain-containing protein n=1 Tax=Dryococelus australis TaxID=614101 RepID=A0ABQ9HMI6_9NEOP|nr:hypothetical protein PR048_011751 [Dryococelus australis]
MKKHCTGLAPRSIGPVKVVEKMGNSMFLVKLGPRCVMKRHRDDLHIARTPVGKRCKETQISPVPRRSERSIPGSTHSEIDNTCTNENNHTSPGIPCTENRRIEQPLNPNNTVAVNTPPSYKHCIIQRPLRSCLICSLPVDLVHTRAAPGRVEFCCSHHLGIRDYHIDSSNLSPPSDAPSPAYKSFHCDKCDTVFTHNDIVYWHEKKCKVTVWRSWGSVCKSGSKTFTSRFSARQHEEIKLLLTRVVWIPSQDVILGECELLGWWGTHILSLTRTSPSGNVGTSLALLYSSSSSPLQFCQLYLRLPFDRSNLSREMLEIADGIGVRCDGTRELDNLKRHFETSCTGSQQLHLAPPLPSPPWSCMDRYGSKWVRTSSRLLVLHLHSECDRLVFCEEEVVHPYYERWWMHKALFYHSQLSEMQDGAMKDAPRTTISKTTRRAAFGDNKVKTFWWFKQAVLKETKRQGKFDEEAGRYRLPLAYIFRLAARRLGNAAQRACCVRMAGAVLLLSSLAPTPAFDCVMSRAACVLATTSPSVSMFPPTAAAMAIGSAMTWADLASGDSYGFLMINCVTRSATAKFVSATSLRLEGYYM